LLFTLPAYFILNPVFRSLGAERGLSESLALLGVSLTGISSAAGRLVVSWVSDKIGRKAAMIGVALLILGASLIMVVGTSLVFLLCIMLISFGFGGSSSVYAAMTAESFGTKYGGMNFGLVMLGFGVSALAFPIIANSLSANGGYAGSFILAAATCVVAVILVLLMDNPSAKAKTN
jgi:OFA family oxalate/formate antiporter-like MFS transporter